MLYGLSCNRFDSKVALVCCRQRSRTVCGWGMASPCTDSRRNQTAKLEMNLFKWFKWIFSNFVFQKLRDWVVQHCDQFSNGFLRSTSDMVRNDPAALVVCGLGRVSAKVPAIGPDDCAGKQSHLQKLEVKSWKRTKTALFIFNCLDICLYTPKYMNLIFTLVFIQTSSFSAEFPLTGILFFDILWRFVWSYWVSTRHIGRLCTMYCLDFIDRPASLLCQDPAAEPLACLWTESSQILMFNTFNKDVKHAAYEKGFGKWPKRWGKLVDRSAAFDETPPKNTKNTVQARGAWQQKCKKHQPSAQSALVCFSSRARCLSLSAGAGFVNGVLEKGISRM